MNNNEYYNREGFNLAEESVADQVFKEEQMISNFFDECYNTLSEDKIAALRNLRPEIQNMIIGYIRGEMSCENLRERMKEFIKLKNKEYIEFVRVNPNNPYILQANGELEQVLLSNLSKLVTFNVLERIENEKDRQSAKMLGEKLGIKKD